MSKESKRSTEPRSKLSKEERWGQRSLIISVLLNGVILLINLYLSSVEANLERTRREEQYFMGNQRNVSFLIAQQRLLHSSLNQLKMLRRLVRNQITTDENKVLLLDEKNRQNEIDRSERQIVMGTWLLANDPPEGISPDQFFAGVTTEQLHTKFPEYQDEAFKYADSLKNEMNKLSGKASFLKPIQFSITILSMIAVVIGSILLFRVGKTVKAEIPKTA